MAFNYRVFIVVPIIYVPPINFPILFMIDSQHSSHALAMLPFFAPPLFTCRLCPWYMSAACNVHVYNMQCTCLQHAMYMSTTCNVHVYMSTTCNVHVIGTHHSKPHPHLGCGYSWQQTRVQSSNIPID